MSGLESTRPYRKDEGKSGNRKSKSRVTAKLEGLIARKQADCERAWLLE